MPITDLALAKQHLRETSTGQDSIISAYLDAAEGMAEHYCNRSFAAPLPKAVQTGVLLMLDSVYNERTDAPAFAVMPGSAVAALLGTAKEWAHDSDGIAPAGVGFDPDVMLIGDAWSRQWAWKDEAGAAINVTGFTGTFELLRGSEVVHSGSLTVDSAPGGTFSYSLPDLTDVITAGQHWYRVRVTSGASTYTLDRKLVNVQ